MSLRFINIEVRASLSCANVFLQFDQSLTETEFLKIQVNSEAINLKEYSTETRVEMQRHFSIEADTISNLVVEECNASFRINISKSLIKNKNSNNDGIRINPDLELKPDVQAGEVISVHCKNCKQALTPQQQFTRILEFPTGFVDVGDLFCHHGPGFDQVLTPKLQDLFYGFRFLVLNTTLLCKKTKNKQSNIYCNRCLCYLGHTLFEDRATKIWCDNVVFQTPSQGSELREVYVNEELPPTIQLLHKITREFNLDGELFQHWTFSKVMLESIFPDRKCHYLLLNILESQLEVLRNSQPLAHGSIHNNNNILQVDLKKCKCFKLLYRLGDESEVSEGEKEYRSERATETEKEDTPLLTFWKQDINIHSLKISPTLFKKLLIELDENSLLLPEVYRLTNDGFQLSYVFYN